MKISIEELKTERQWRSATGYDQERFEKLLVIFKAKYEELHRNCSTHTLKSEQK